jgi:hypothetical protein
MSKKDREQKVKENIDSILRNDKYYFSKIKALFQKLLEILEFRKDHFNKFDKEYEILN